MLAEAPAAGRLVLPLARATDWLPGVRKNWEVFGDQIGVPAAASAPKTLSDQTDLRKKVNVLSMPLPEQRRGMAAE